MQNDIPDTHKIMLFAIFASPNQIHVTIRVGYLCIFRGYSLGQVGFITFTGTKTIF